MVLDGVGHNHDAGLEESGLRLIGEGTGGVATCVVRERRKALRSSRAKRRTNDVADSNVAGSLHDGTLGERRRASGGETNGNNILRVLDGNKNTGSELELLPGLAEIDDVDTLVDMSVLDGKKVGAINVPDRYACTRSES